MHPKFDEIKKTASEDLVEKKYWIKPSIDVHDFVEMTQGPTTNYDNTWDGVDGYS